MSLSEFHPLIQKWFQSRFSGPTEPQTEGWPIIASGKHALIAAPTGSGKTLTAFLACIDQLLKLSLLQELTDETHIVYVSPLRALSNDMHRNLEVPLAEIFDLILEEGELAAPIRVGLRTGDTTSSQRASLVRKPPHILVTTPESLYLLLTAQKGRETLRNVSTVIVDEIHALVRDKRGSHLGLTLERLEHVTEQPLQRIGLSATQRPIETIAQFLTGVGNNNADVEIINVGHNRELDLKIEVPPSELSAVCSHEQWAEVYERIVELVNAHRSTLIFVNTRRMAERVTHQLTELLGEDSVSSHHGSLSAKIRLETERKLKEGELKAVVATASLELGLDVGYIDLVIQIGSPRSIATFLQRIGRSGHSLGLTPKGRLFALTRDELMECMALIRAVDAGRLDVIRIPESPLDILAQQIVAEVAAEEWDTDALFALFKQSYAYQHLTREQFDSTVQYLSEGIAKANGRSRVYLHHDQVQNRLRARKGARIAATTNAGAIPEIASYRVVLDPDNMVVGSVDEDFAVESQRGDVFLLGNTSWRILYVRGGDVTVVDAQGAPPSVPFWEGEAPGRTLELSEEVSRFREELEAHLGNSENSKQWLVDTTNCSTQAAEQIVQYATAQKAAIGLLPTQKQVVFERFFDETGGMQLVVHAPFGSAITKAWGFSMRKRFCRSFDFELQATADDDGFILSLGPQHSFPIESLFPMLTSRNARGLLEQAILTVPMFLVRWRWNVTRSLLVMRRNFGKKIPPALQRFRADDLLTAVFPKLTGCQEEHTGDHEVPDHPLAKQTMHDCLTETLDIEGLERVLKEVEQGEITFSARDTREPSPFAYELLNSNPYAFLDGGEIQERRTRAVSTRRSISIESVSDLGELDATAITQVREEATPLVRDADELHDALLGRILLPVAEGTAWQAWFAELAEQKRATNFTIENGETTANAQFWVAAERLPAATAAFPESSINPEITTPQSVVREWNTLDARIAMVRGLLEVCGPTSTDKVAACLSITTSQADAALEALEGEGVVLRGHFTPRTATGQNLSANSSTSKIRQQSILLDGQPSSDDQPASTEQTQQSGERTVEWCHRRLLARIHRLTLQGLRKQIEPVSVSSFIQFLTHHHGVQQDHRKNGTDGLFEIIAMLQGIDIPASSWEQNILAARMRDYQTSWLDELCLTGEVTWGRLFPPLRNTEQHKTSASLTRVAPVSIILRSDLDWLTAFHTSQPETTLSGTATDLLQHLQEQGAAFAIDLKQRFQLLPSHLQEALGELVTRGLINADGFAGLRQLISAKGEQKQSRRRRMRGYQRQRRTQHNVGRWSCFTKPSITEHEEIVQHDDQQFQEVTEQWAWQLLRRWGVVFRDLLTKEQGAPRWFDLLQVYRRLEARGEIRGGRFIAGVAGEQFAVGETVSKLRQLRDADSASELVVVNATDPLNLVGILTQHARLPSLTTNKLALLNGQPVAICQKGEARFYKELSELVRAQIMEQFGLTGSAMPRQVKTDEPEQQDKQKSSKPPQRTGIPRPLIT